MTRLTLTIHEKKISFVYNGRFSMTGSEPTPTPKARVERLAYLQETFVADHTEILLAQTKAESKALEKLAEVSMELELSDCYMGEEDQVNLRDGIDRFLAGE